MRPLCIVIKLFVMKSPSCAPCDVGTMLDRLDRAVAELGVNHPRAAQVVQLRFIGGLTIEEIAEELALSTGTVKREWTFAKAWLAAAMEASD